MAGGRNIGNKEKKGAAQVSSLFLEVVFTEMRKAGGPDLGVDW